MSGSEAGNGTGEGALRGLRLFSLARALGQALTPNEVAAAVFDHAISSFGASTIGLWLLGDDGIIRFAGGAGDQEPGGPEAVGEMPLDSDLPAATAIRTGQLIGYGSTSERDSRWPSLVGLRTLSQAVAVVPLPGRDRALGALHIGWADPRDSFDPITELLGGLADLCATALDRSQLYERERLARETLEFLNQGTRLMVSALDPQQIVRSLVELAVPRLAPWCAVYVAEQDHLVRVAVEIAPDPLLAGELRNAGPIPIAADIPLSAVYRSGETAVVAHVPAEMVARTYPAEQARKVLALGDTNWSAIVVPVRTGGEVIGVMSLVSPDWAERPPPEVSYAAEGLAARAGVALHNARLYREQVDNVTMLTAALLPEGVPTIEGVRFAARYVPASGGVCGDWYEAELMPDGRVLVGIGDASGHGLVAAATMARVRHAARGLAFAGIQPARMMEHLSQLLSPGITDQIATAVYGVIDPKTGSGTWACAGHPPPIMIGPDRTVTCLPLQPGPPIGAGFMTHTEEAVELPAGARLVLYTDGVFERRGEDPSAGIERLVDTVRDVADGSEGDIAQAVMSKRGETDDACVLVIGR